MQMTDCFADLSSEKNPLSSLTPPNFFREAFYSHPSME